MSSSGVLRFGRNPSFFLMGLLGLVGISLPVSVHAAVLVTEIMYNPIGANVGHQWVEVSNTGTDSIDLGAKNIRLFDASGNHVIKAYGTGNTVLSAGGVAVLAQNPLTFLNDYPSYAGILLKSSFTLTASGILGITQTDGTILDKVSYSSEQGAKGDGNSLQRSQGMSQNQGTALVVAAPTPGVYPLRLPAALLAPVKQIAASKSSTKYGKKTSKSVTSKTHGKGTTAPADSADAASAGALSGKSDLPDFSFSMPSFSLLYMPLFSSVWFVSFLALLGFSAFSILVIQRQYASEVYG